MDLVLVFRIPLLLHKSTIIVNPCNRFRCAYRCQTNSSTIYKHGISVSSMDLRRFARNPHDTFGPSMDINIFIYWFQLTAYSKYGKSVGNFSVVLKT